MKFFGKSKSGDPRQKQGKADPVVIAPPQSQKVEPEPKLPVVPVIKQEEKTITAPRDDEKQTSGLFTRFQKKPDSPSERHDHSEKTVIGKTVVITGEISGGEEVHVDGRVDGDICILSKIGIGISGVVEGKIEAQEVRVSGKIRGEIKARSKCDVSATGDIEGSVMTPRFVVADGATIRGSIKTTQLRIQNDTDGPDLKKRHAELPVMTTPEPSPKTVSSPTPIPVAPPAPETVPPQKTESTHQKTEPPLLPLETVITQTDKSEAPKGSDTGGKKHSGQGNMKSGKRY